MLFLASTLALSVALQRNAILTTEHAVLSLAALVPASLGMNCGRLIRQRLSESLFRRAFFASLLLLGLYIVVSALD